MAFPGRVECAYKPCQNAVGYSHGDAAGNGQLPATDLIEDKDDNAGPEQLTDVDYS